MELRSFSPVLANVRGEPRYSAWVIIFGGFSSGFLKLVPLSRAHSCGRWRPLKKYITSPRLICSWRAVSCRRYRTARSFSRVFTQVLSRDEFVCACVARAYYHVSYLFPRSRCQIFGRGIIAREHLIIISIHTQRNVDSDVINFDISRILSWLKNICIYYYTYTYIIHIDMDIYIYI